MKILLVSLFSSIAVLAGPVMRLDGPNGYFIEATMLQDSKLIAKTSNSASCTGSYLKDMVAKRMMVIFDGECARENLTIYFSDEDYRMFYSGANVTVEYDSDLCPGERQNGTARIIN